MSHVTQKEMIVKYLWAKRGVWVPGHVLVSKASSMIGKDYLVQDADTRAHEMAKVGYWESPNNRYFIEHKKEGKYAQFRCTHREPKQTREQLLKDNERLLEWFENQPETPIQTV